ncbi:hypothetical protein QJQ45_023398 [Haematococcus lacustris]|nr:hypothetical protein QJQ45_023398 [Haematococcus lacustris]
MALRQLRGLARTVLSSKLTPERGGAGAPIKLAPRPDRPVRACGYYQTCIYHAHSDSNYGALQLPLWYELWWDNGVFPGQLCCDFMAGPMTCNLTEAWYAKAWSVLSLVIALPIMYHYYYVDEFRHPMQEPDYGLVAELKQGRKYEPLPQRNDFGLAAEVARRQGQLPDLNQAATRLPNTTGGAYSARTRRRLAAVRPPVDFGIAREVATSEAQPNQVDPFSEANRASRADPFVMADDMVKFPTPAYVPGEAHAQELPAGPVPIKVPAPSSGTTTAVTTDNRHYGLARELGGDVCPASTSCCQQAALRYFYDQDTGMLCPPEGVQGEGGRAVREYIEDVVTGQFYQLNKPGLVRRLLSRFRRKAERPEAETELQEGDEGWDPDAGTFRGSLRSFLANISGVFSFLGIAVQGLLGGLALLNFYMTFILYANNNLQNWLRYYAVLALAINRIYFSLIAMAVVASAARLARDQIRSFAPLKAGLRVADWLQLLLYILAFITSVLCTPLDDELTYEAERNPRFYSLTLSSAFVRRLNVWRVLNVLRTIGAGGAWLVCAYQHSTLVTDGVAAAEVARRFKHIKQQRNRPRPDLIMAHTGSGPKPDGPPNPPATNVTAGPPRPTDASSGADTEATEAQGTVTAQRHTAKPDPGQGLGLHLALVLVLARKAALPWYAGTAAAAAAGA